MDCDEHRRRHRGVGSSVVFSQRRQGHAGHFGDRAAAGRIGLADRLGRPSHTRWPLIFAGRNGKAGRCGSEHHPHSSNRAKADSPCFAIPPKLSNIQDVDPRDAIRTSIREASRPSGTFWVMNALATVIACYGLFSNSAAVVIGAMVVAMLLGPIAGIALGLTDKDHALLGAALSCLVGGIAWILLVAVVIGAIHRDAPLTEEIISRTSPTLFDLMIALAGGAAGGIATVSPRIGAAIVGVAIATALVPPLAASGILLARGDFDLAWNAFVLALTNVIAIQFAFSVVLWLNGFRGQTYVAGRGIVEFLRRNFVDVAIVCLLSAVLGLRLHHVITAALFESQVRSVLQQQAGRLSG
ncbi:MAG: TIGR00341 family protein, partial [Xanthobacteraceae bacterium]